MRTNDDPKPAHTALPRLRVAMMRHNGCTIINDLDDMNAPVVAIVTGENNEERAGEIVRACNAFPAMVEALEPVRAELEDGDTIDHEDDGCAQIFLHGHQVRALLAALALAKGGE